MSGSRNFRTPSYGGSNNFWQKRSGDNFSIELIPETGVNSVFISKDLTVSNTITVTSSETCKENIKSIDHDVDDLCRLTPKQYNYKEDEKIHYGFIAEEVEAIYPNLVTSTNGLKGLNYLEIIPLLLNKINDLQEQINDLKVNTNK